MLVLFATLSCTTVPCSGAVGRRLSTRLLTKWHRHLRSALLCTDCRIVVRACRGPVRVQQRLLFVCSSALHRKVHGFMLLCLDILLTRCLMPGPGGPVPLPLLGHPEHFRWCPCCFSLACSTCTVSSTPFYGGL